MDQIVQPSTPTILDRQGVSQIASVWEQFVPYSTAELMAASMMTQEDLKALLGQMLDDTRSSKGQVVWQTIVDSARAQWKHRMPADRAAPEKERDALAAILADALELHLRKQVETKSAGKQKKPSGPKAPTLAEQLANPLAHPETATRQHLTTLTWAKLYANQRLLAYDHSLPKPLRDIFSNSNTLRGHIRDLNLPGARDRKGEWEATALALGKQAQMIDHRLVKPNLNPLQADGRDGTLAKTEQHYMIYLTRALEQYPDLRQELGRTRTSYGSALYGPERTSNPEEAYKQFAAKVADIRVRAKARGADVRYLDIIDLERDLAQAPDLAMALRQTREAHEDHKLNHPALVNEERFIAAVEAIRQQFTARGLKLTSHFPEKEKKPGVIAQLFGRQPKQKTTVPLNIPTTIEMEAVGEVHPPGLYSTPGNEKLRNQVDLSDRIRRATALVREAATLMNARRQDDYRAAYGESGAGDAVLIKRSFIASRLLDGQQIYGLLDNGAAKNLQKAPVSGYHKQQEEERTRMLGELDQRRAATFIQAALLPLVGSEPPRALPSKVALIDDEAPQQAEPIPQVTKRPENYVHPQFRYQPPAAPAVNGKTRADQIEMQSSGVNLEYWRAPIKNTGPVTPDIEPTPEELVRRVEAREKARPKASDEPPSPLPPAKSKPLPLRPTQADKARHEAEQREAAIRAEVEAEVARRLRKAGQETRKTGSSAKAKTTPQSDVLQLDPQPPHTAPTAIDKTLEQVRQLMGGEPPRSFAKKEADRKTKAAERKANGKA